MNVWRVLNQKMRLFLSLSVPEETAGSQWSKNVNIVKAVINVPM